MAKAKSLKSIVVEKRQIGVLAQKEDTFTYVTIFSAPKEFEYPSNKCLLSFCLLRLIFDTR